MGKTVNFKGKSFGANPTIDGNPRRPSSQSNSGSPDGPVSGLVAEESGYSHADSGRGKGVAGVGITYEGDEAAGGGSSRAPVSSGPSVSPGVGGTAYIGGVVGGVGAEGGEGTDDEANVPRNVSMKESGGTNPLYKSVAPLTTSGSVPQAVSHE